MNPQFNKGVIEMCVMSLLMKRDFYGYELVEAISQRIEISEGTIYPILRRIITDGLAEAYLQESPSGPPRKYYKITALGRRETLELMKEWESFVMDVDQIMYARDHPAKNRAKESIDKGKVD